MKRFLIALMLWPALALGQGMDHATFCRAASAAFTYAAFSASTGVSADGAVETLRNKLPQLPKEMETAIVSEVYSHSAYYVQELRNKTIVKKTYAACMQAR